MSITTTGFQNDHGEDMASLDSAAESGSGGGDMPVWSASRQTQLSRLYSGATVTNEAAYEIPSAVIGSGFQNQQFAHELTLGATAKGTAKDGQDDLTGSAKMVHEASGAVLLEEVTTGRFTLFAAPPPGVAGGGDVETPITNASLAVLFSPSFAGLNYVDSDLSKFHNIQYSGVEGTVTSTESQPVQGASISGSGDGATTNADGFYSLLAPVGNSSDLVGLKETKVKSFTAPEGSKATVDWQFAGLLVRVQTPDYSPVPGAPVEIDGETYTSDDNGEVRLTELGLDVEQTIRAFDSDRYEDTVRTPDQEGVYATVQIGPETSNFGDDGGDDDNGGASPAAITLKVLDRASGRPVRNIAVTEPYNDVTTSTTTKGESKIVLPEIPESGTVQLVVAQDNQRYRAEVVAVDVVAGETTDTIIRLTPRPHMTKV